MSFALAQEVEIHMQACALEMSTFLTCWHVRSDGHMINTLACVCTSEGQTEQDPRRGKLSQFQQMFVQSLFGLCEHKPSQVRSLDR